MGGRVAQLPIGGEWWPTLSRRHAGRGGSRDLDRDHWALFDLASDFAEASDVSAAHPDVVSGLQQLWQAAAERNQVLPIGDGLMTRLGALI